MRKYIALKRQTLSHGDFKIVPIRDADKYDIMNWRNEQIFHLRQEKPLTKFDQENYFNNVITKLFEKEQPSQLLFSYLQREECIGYGGLVHINWIDKNAEISFIMNTKLEKKQFSIHWGIFLKLIEQVAFKELNLYKLYTFAFDLRPNLYEILEDSGYIKEKEINNFPVKIIIHSKYYK